MALPNIRLRVLPSILPTDGREIELATSATHIQWRYLDPIGGDGDWVDLVALADLTGAAGPAIELRSNGTHIQYRSIGDVTWIDVIPLADVTGGQGEPGPPGEQGEPGIGLEDGDKGDVTVSSSGTAWAVNAGAITRAKVEGDFAKGIGLNVFEYGAVGDGTTNDAAAFAATQAAAISAGSKLVVVPAGDYRVNTQIDIEDGVTWLFLGANINTSLDTMHIFSAVEVNDWSVLGRLTLNGSLVSAADTDQVGLYIENCDRYLVENVMTKAFKGKGIWVTGDDAVGSYRGDRGQFANCSAFECTTGIQLDAGAGAEYNTWVNVNVSGCIVGVEIGAGNTVFLGGSIVDNTDGVVLVAGTNHGHGIFSGTQISHNTSLNVHAIGVVNGYSFEGCHLYGNAVDSSAGAIWLEQCKGVNFNGGVVDCWVYNDGGASSGDNIFSGIDMQGSNGRVRRLVTAGDNGTGLGKLVFRDCTGAGSRDSSGLTINNYEPLVSFNSTTALGGSQGLSVSKNSTGDYTLTWPRPFKSAYYSLAVSAIANGSGHQFGFSIISQSTTQARIAFYVDNGTPVLTDCTQMNVRAFE